MKPIHCSALLLAAFLAACSNRAAPPAAEAEKPVLKAPSSWQVEWLGERPLLDNSHLTLVLGEDSRAYGDGGCNRWLAGFQLQGEQIHFTEGGSTLMLCPEALMEQEQRFFVMLKAVSHWDFSANGQLQLWSADGSAPIRLWPSTAD